MKRTHRWMMLLLILATGAAVSAGQTAEPPPWDVILKAHRVNWAEVPSTVQIVGVTTREDQTQSLTIIGTAQEDMVKQTGPHKEVATRTRFFKDDGEKSVRQPTLAGFTQLDLTGVFLVAQLRARGVETEPPQRTAFRNAPAWRIRVNGGRSEMHYRQMEVKDEFDLYVDDSGLLVGIERVFYKEAPVFTHTVTVVFSEYQPGTGGVLLPHRIERYIKGYKAETILVGGYTFGVPAQQFLFEPRRMTR